MKTLNWNAGVILNPISKRNRIHFTPAQVEAIKSGTCKGLSLIVGPPGNIKIHFTGTGKTDVAVQIISNLYNNFKKEHILVVARSNMALNHLFEKIMMLDIDQRHLLRLGHGANNVDITVGNSLENSDWGQSGRVDAFLALRIELLGEVNRLATSIGVTGAHGDTCSNAQYFFSAHIQPLWNAFLKKTARKPTMDIILTDFPFSSYFESSMHHFEKFGGFENGISEALDFAKGLYLLIEDLFTKLESIQPFELLRSNKDRQNYLLVKEARIVCMTTTHAAMKRRELVRLGFHYDSVIMEEAAQLMEVETFIPLLMQSRDLNNVARLKRICLIGDHHQLCPIIKNAAISSYGNLQQSMFARLIRLSVPFVQLDMQARCRSSICDLYRWNYEKLSDLPNCFPDSAENIGFKYEYQFINVEDYNGKGETAPRPFFVQNLGEAEYVVAVYRYMILKG